MFIAQTAASLMLLTVVVLPYTRSPLCTYLRRRWLVWFGGYPTQTEFHTSCCTEKRKRRTTWKFKWWKNRAQEQTPKGPRQSARERWLKCHSFCVERLFVRFLSRCVFRVRYQKQQQQQWCKMLPHAKWHKLFFRGQ